MVVVSYSGKEINAKLVYYGPGLSGKTTNLEYIYQSVPSTNRGKMVSMKTRTERTLFFDFLPIDLGDIGGFKTRFLLYTVPGQVYYNATRKLVLRGVDAVIFVADSGRGKMEENIESLQNLRENLREYGLSLDEMPWVIQYNKRDLPDAYSIEELEAALNPGGAPYFEAVATGGQGVFEAFRGIARLLLNKLSKEIKLGAGSRPQASAPAAPAPASDDPASRTPPPGLMTGGPSPRAYRPPAGRTAPETPSGVMPRPATIPGPQRPQAPPVAGRTPPSASAASGAPTKGGYRPPVPGTSQDAGMGATGMGPAPGTRPRAPEPPRKAAPPPPAPPEPVQTPSGAAWFGEDSPTRAMERPRLDGGEDSFSPSLELDTPQPAAFAGSANADDSADDDWTRMDSSDAVDPVGLDTGFGSADEPETEEYALDGPAPALDRVETLARQFQETQGASMDEMELDEEDTPGFWGRLFRRRKDREEPVKYRRYPSRSDMPTVPEVRSAVPPPVVPPPAFPEEPASARVYRDPEPEPLSATVELQLTDPAEDSMAWDAVDEPAEDFEPVVIERTVEVPLTLTAEELRRGACVRLTLEVRIDQGSRSEGFSDLEDTEAA